MHRSVFDEIDELSESGAWVNATGWAKKILNEKKKDCLLNQSLLSKGLVGM